MARLSVRLFGGLQIRLASGAAVALPTRKAQALLAYLAVPPGRAHARAKLAALLWGGIRDASARASLRQALFAIRKAMVGALVIEAGSVSLARDAATVEVDEFERALAADNPDALARAIDVYQGDFLARLVVDESPWEEWLLGERERLRELALDACARLLAHRQRDGAALRQYQQCVNALHRELGTEPEAETKQLDEEILRGRITRASTTAVPAPDPLRTVMPTARRTSPLVGRTTEIAELGDALDRARTGRGSVVAVIGEAGVGKSRLVSELAATATARDLSVLTGHAAACSPTSRP